MSDPFRFVNLSSSFVMLTLFISISGELPALEKAESRSRTFQYGSRIWQTDDGLPQNSVQALVQTRDGYLWIGTQNGLARFDGVQFRIYDPRNTPALLSAQIYALAQSDDDSLWIGTMNSGLVRLRNGSFELFSEKDGLGCDAIRAILPARDGSVWIGTTNGLFHFQGEKFISVTEADGLSNPVVRALCEDPDGSILAGTSASAFRVREGKATRAFEGLPGPVMRSLCVARDGVYWLGYAGGIVRIADGKLDDSLSVRLPDNIVNTIFQDRHGQMWMGTYGGLSRLVGTNWVAEKTSEGAAFDAVNCMVEDREGNIWVGTKDGLVRFHPWFFQRFTIQQGLAHNNTVTVCEDRNGTIWTGTWGGGLHGIKDGKIELHNYAKGLSKDQVLALHEDRQGALWVGTDFDGGLNRIHDGVITKFLATNGLVDPAIRVLHEDRAGRLWIGTSRALVLFKDGKFHRFTGEDGLIGGNIRAIFEDDEGTLWIGTNEGLTWFKGDRFSPFPGALPAKTVVSLYQDAERDIWIGTVGGGLCRIKNAEAISTHHASRITPYTTKQGLFSDDIHEILEDDLGFLWVSCRYGIFRVRKKDFDDLDNRQIPSLKCRVFGKRDGLPSIECSVVAKPGAWKARDGKLWFATAKGLAAIDPQLDLGANETPPLLMIEEVIADKKQVTSGMWPVPRNASHPVTRHSSLVTIPPGRGEIEIHYTALSLTDSEKNRFRYRLEGFDRDWIDAGTRRVAFYNQLPPGNYDFQVMACNNDGVWNPLGANVKFTLQPHFWQTFWFKGGTAGVLLGLVGWSVRSVSVRKLERQMRELEQQTALANERSRIAKDMHDDLGARLTQIMLLSDVAEKSDDAGPKTKSHVSKIAGASRELVENLDAIVWAVDPGNDTLDQLALYLHDYVDRYLSTAGIQGCFEIPSDLPTRSISSQVRHDLFMVVKEALNNAVKYSQCREIHFSLALKGGELWLRIADNGRGFSRDSTRPTGNGLQNMADRMKRNGGSFELESEPGKGTRIQLRIPIEAIPNGFGKM